MSRIQELFTAYGADYPATMQRYMGNEALYLKIFKMLFQDDNLQKLGAALASDDLAAAFEAAHTLKGVAGNLGLDPYFQAVCAIVEPLRAREPREDYPALYETILAEYQRLEQLEALLEGGE